MPATSGLISTNQVSKDKPLGLPADPRSFLSPNHRIKFIVLMYMDATKLLDCNFSARLATNLTHVGYSANLQYHLSSQYAAERVH